MENINAVLWGPFTIGIILFCGIYHTVKSRFIQLRLWRHLGGNGKNTAKAVASALAASMGTGNITGCAAAISVGGPGAVFWMWVSAFFGMSTAYTESTLAQIFKERKNDEYVGGLAFYGKRLLKGSAIAGIVLSLMYIVYALLCFPAQGFNTVSSVAQIAEEITGNTIPTNSALYWVSFVVVIALMIAISFGGIKKITKVTDIVVPVMAVIYILTVVVLIIVNKR